MVPATSDYVSRYCERFISAVYKTRGDILHYCYRIYIDHDGTALTLHHVTPAASCDVYIMCSNIPTAWPWACDDHKIVIR